MTWDFASPCATLVSSRGATASSLLKTLKTGYVAVSEYFQSWPMLKNLQSLNLAAHRSLKILRWLRLMETSSRNAWFVLVVSFTQWACWTWASDAYWQEAYCFTQSAFWGRFWCLQQKASCWTSEWIWIREQGVVFGLQILEGVWVESFELALMLTELESDAWVHLSWFSSFGQKFQFFNF